MSKNDAKGEQQDTQIQNVYKNSHNPPQLLKETEIEYNLFFSDSALEEPSNDTTHGSLQ